MDPKSKAKIDALVDAGFKLSRGKGWSGGGLRFTEEEIAKLELHELDQVLEGVRQGAREVSLGPKGTFKIRKK